MKRIVYYYVISAMMICSITACKKYLDAKPDTKLNTLNTLQNLQSLLDDNIRLNFQWGYAAEVSANDYYVTDIDLAAITNNGDRRMYTWEANNVFQSSDNGWYYAYLPVYYGNSILESLPDIIRDNTNSGTYDNIKGQAYFFKGAAMLHASFVWCQGYEESTAKQQLGLPIRTSTNFNVISVRANLADTYQQIITDLKQAAVLLNVNQVHTMRPSKAAAFAMLSRAYLSMNKYTEAALYADSVLQLNNQLLDYNTLNAAAENPFPEYKEEILTYLSMPAPVILSQSVAKISNELYARYATGDLRKTVFFKSTGNNSWSFKGNYSGNTNLFCGPAVDEMYLNRAEGYARAGKLTDALNDLNQLMVKRWNKAIAYIPYQSNQQETVINWILEERRKELLMRGLRWVDIKRLNHIGANISLTRNMNGNSKVLKPNDLRFALPIPEDVIRLSGMEQNP
jgi:hypothetical protein